MANLSTARKLNILARVAGRQVGRTRTGNALWQGLRAAGTHLSQALRQLWLEVTGFVFLALAAIGGFALTREYPKYHAGQAGLGRVIVAICFTCVFAWFGLSSFWRARRRVKD